MKQYYENDLTLEKGLKLTVKVLKKSLDKNKMNGENVEIFVLENKEGEIYQRFITEKEITEYLTEVEKEEALEKEKADKKMEF